MRFEWVPSEEAEGAILAHTHKLNRRTLKKGARLAAADVVDLCAEGLGHVMVARLEELDVDEDVAAQRLAEKIYGPNVRVSRANTGRSNLYAETSGLLVVDRAGVDAVNNIHEALTLATLPEFSVVADGTMVGTVKVIPFAVPEETVAHCEAAALASAPLLRVAPLRSMRVGVLLTELSGTHEKVIDRASTSLRTRVERLGSQVARELRCSHEPEAAARALQELLDTGCDPILMLGASAIVDRRDVFPAALESLGGTIEHLGMPVDPGNLLLLARRNETTLIGVPGCARSLKPSGFDWVLQRVSAGISVKSADLAGMGVGGLLKEPPSRPMPRETSEPATPADVDDPSFAVIVLAAGQSRRMGTANKLLSEVEGRPMIARAVDAGLASEAASVLVVTGHEAEGIREALRGREVSFAHNPEYADGLSTSLRVGIGALPDGIDGALVCLADMPWVAAEHLDALMAAFDPDDDRGIYVPVFDRKRGNPVLWHRRYFEEMAALSGDQGARPLLERYADEISYIPLESRAINIDVDTPEALRELRRPD